MKDLVALKVGDLYPGDRAEGARYSDWRRQAQRRSNGQNMTVGDDASETVIAVLLVAAPSLLIRNGATLSCFADTKRLQQISTGNEGECDDQAPDDCPARRSRGHGPEKHRRSIHAWETARSGPLACWNESPPWKGEFAEIRCWRGVPGHEG